MSNYLVNIECKECWKIWDTITGQWLVVTHGVLCDLIEKAEGELSTITQKYYVYTTPYGIDYETPVGDEISVCLEFKLDYDKENNTCKINKYKIYNKEPLKNIKGFSDELAEKYSAWINTINLSGMEKLVYGKSTKQNTKQKEMKNNEFFQSLLQQQLEEANKWWNNLSDEDKINYYVNNKGGK